MAFTSGRLKLDFDFLETVTSNIGASAADAVLQHKLSLNQTVPNGTTIPVTVGGTWSLSLTSSTAYIDATALPKANGATADCTGLKLQAFCLKNPTGNGTITIAHNTSTSVSAYNFIGTSGSVQVQAGGLFFWHAPEAAADVASNAKNIILSGTGTQSCHVAAIFG